jgi:hypothetical protein
MEIKLYQKTVTHLNTLSIRYLFYLIPLAIIISSILSLVIINLQPIFQQPHENGQRLIFAHSIAIGFAIFMVYKVRSNHSPSTIEDNRPFRKSLMLSVSVGILLIPFLTYLVVWQSRYEQMEWYIYGFYDKRWILALYWLSILTFLILPSIFSRLLSQPIVSDGGNETNTAVPYMVTTTNRLPLFYRVVKVIILPLLIAFLLFGPPWNISRTPLSIDFHEQVHLGPLQAIEKGYLPNIGPASQQYGPGTQLITYAYMDWSNQFNMVGFREAQGLIYWISFSIFAVIAFYFLRLEWAVLAVLLSFTVSPFAMIVGLETEGTWTQNWWIQGGLELWGWPNPLRYIGSLVFAVLLPSVIMTRNRPYLLSIVAGFVWGVFCWTAQENLVMGVATGALVFTLAWATNTISLRDGLYRVVWIVIGFLIFWMPILLFYYSKGLAQIYLSNMLLVGGQVIQGFSNTPPSFRIFGNIYLGMLLFLSTPFLILCGLALVYKHSTLYRPLSQIRLTLIALICVTLANFFGSWTRSDAEHILNTLISVPILFALIVQDLPVVLGQHGRQRHVFRLCLLVLVILFSWNPAAHTIQWYQQKFTNPLQKFNAADLSTSAIAIEQSPAFDRVGYPQIATDEMFLHEPPLLVMDLLAEMDNLHTLSGKVYIHSFPHTTPALVYFLADLYPPPIYSDPLTMVFSEEVMATFMQQFETIINEVDHIVSIQLDVAEVEIFMVAHPEAVIQEKTFGEQIYYIISRS